VTVGLEWDGCGARKLVLEAGHDGPLSIRSTLFEHPFDVTVEKGNKPKSLASDGDRVSFQAVRRTVYTFTRDTTFACEH
jgi:hypothetical protein